MEVKQDFKIDKGAGPQGERSEDGRRRREKKEINTRRSLNDEDEWLAYLCLVHTLSNRVFG